MRESGLGVKRNHWKEKIEYYRAHFHIGEHKADYGANNKPVFQLTLLKVFSEQL